MKLSQSCGATSSQPGPGCAYGNTAALCYIYKDIVLLRGEIFVVGSKYCEKQGKECGKMREREERGCHRWGDAPFSAFCWIFFAKATRAAAHSPHLS